MAIMQGDQYPIPFIITDENDLVLTDEYIRNVEITIGDIIKSVPEVSYNAEAEVWEFPLYQDESFQISQKSVPVQLRIVTYNSDIYGVDLGKIQILQSISKEVL